MSIGVVVLAIFFVVFQYLPLNKKARELNAASTNLIVDNTAANERIARLPELYEQIENLKQEVGNFDVKIPTGRSHGPFLQKLAQVMQQNGLTELVIQPGIEIETAQVSAIPVNIRCSGKMFQIFNFFKAVEGFERIIRIEEVSLVNSNSLDGNLAVNINAEIFYRVQ